MAHHVFYRTISCTVVARTILVNCGLFVERVLAIHYIYVLSSQKIK